MSRLLFEFHRLETIRYISHLDMLRLFQRAFYRSGLPLEFSQGYNPHLKFNLAAPLPLGATAAGEFGEIELGAEVEPELFLDKLAPQLPGGLTLAGAAVLEDNSPALPSLVEAASYEAEPAGFSDLLSAQRAGAAVGGLMAADEVAIQKKNKKGKTVTVNIRPHIFETEALYSSIGLLKVKMLLKAGSAGGVAPAVVLGKLNDFTGGLMPAENWSLHRSGLYCLLDGQMKPLTEGMCFIQWIKK